MGEKEITLMEGVHLNKGLTDFGQRSKLSSHHIYVAGGSCGGGVQLDSQLQLTLPQQSCR